MAKESEKSELQLLLEKNAYGEGLTEEEHKKAILLIVRPEKKSGETCWICKLPAIFDTGLCSGCALEALITRK